MIADSNDRAVPREVTSQEVIDELCVGLDASCEVLLGDLRIVTLAIARALHRVLLDVPGLKSGLGVTDFRTEKRCQCL